MRWKALLLLMVMGCSTTPSPSLTPAKADSPPANAADGPTTILDQRGHSVTLPHAALRIVSLSPALTETLFAVGCGAHVVLRDGWSDFPAEVRSVPSVQGFAPSAEAILAARPDLVLTNYPPPALASALDAAHVPWLAFTPKHMADVTQALRAVALACGQKAAGERLATAFDARIETIRTRVAGRFPPRVFYEMDAGIGGQPYTIGQKTFGQEVLTLAGGDNLFANEPREWFQVSAEAVLDLDPDVVLLGDADVQDQPQSLDTLRRRPTMALLRAVRTGLVFPLHADLVSRPGPRLALGVEEVARLLHPLALLDLPLLQPL